MCVYVCVSVSVCECMCTLECVHICVWFLFLLQDGHVYLYASFMFLFKRREISGLLLVIRMQE
jgi:hypothetical protein